MLRRSSLRSVSAFGSGTGVGRTPTRSSRRRDLDYTQCMLTQAEKGCLMTQVFKALITVLTVSCPLITAAAPSEQALLRPEPLACQALTPAHQGTKIGIPAPLFACFVQQNCPNGCQIQCTGGNVCQSTATTVTCDNATTQCPYPTCAPPPE